MPLFSKSVHEKDNEFQPTMSADAARALQHDVALSLTPRVQSISGRGHVALSLTPRVQSISGRGHQPHTACPIHKWPWPLLAALLPQPREEEEYGSGPVAKLKLLEVAPPRQKCQPYDAYELVPACWPKPQSLWSA